MMETKMTVAYYETTPHFSQSLSIKKYMCIYTLFEFYNKLNLPH